MNLKEPYYERIIYKKDAIGELAGILDKKFGHKKVFFLSEKTAYKKFGTYVVNELNRAGCEFIFKFVDSNCDLSEIQELIGEAKSCKVVVALGGGSVCDAAKYIALNTSLEYIMIPSCPTTTAFFTPFCFINHNFLSEVVKSNYAFKVLIDEDFIKNSSWDLIESGRKFIFCFWEAVLNIEINNLLFEKKVSSLDLKLVLAKAKDNFFLYTKNDEGKLLLMDTFIDLGKIACELDMSLMSGIFLAMLLKSSKAIISSSFGTLCQTATKILFETYKKFFSLKKIDVCSFLDIEALAKNLSFMNVSVDNVKFNNVKNIRQNRPLFLKLNAVKNQIACLIEKYGEEMNIEDIVKENAKVDLAKCVMSYSVLPYVYDCSNLTNVLSGSGLIS